MACCLALSARPAAPAPPPEAWPQILHDAGHTSVSADTQINAESAFTLGLDWMSAMRAADLGGPVSEFNKTLGIPIAYVGDERGDAIAYNAIDGSTVWSTSLGFNDFIRSTPAVGPDGGLWVGTGFDPTIYKLDGATGQVLCAVKVPLRIDSSMMFATPPGGVPTVYTATVDGTNVRYGQLMAIRARDCTVEWSVSPWRNPSGPWDTPAFGVDKNGNGRVLIGTSNTDATLYSIDALTGNLVWYRSEYEPGDYDIGAGPTVSLPGNNGFADGVVYSHSKFGILYAFDLTTGKPIWQYDYDQAGHIGPGGISSVALYKNYLVYGVSDGIEAVTAKTGTLIWHYKHAYDVVASPAIVGPPGLEVVVVGDATGRVFVLRLSDGAQLFSYQTGGYITGSPAIVNGHILIASSDSFLYDFEPGRRVARQPSTAIASPMTGSSVANPGSTVTVTGTATDSTGGGGITELQVAVQLGGPTGPWYDGATGTWGAGAYNNLVGVPNGIRKNTSWSFSFPVQAQGATYQVTANAVDLSGQVDRAGAQSTFAVLPARGQPHLTLSKTDAPPAGSFTADGGGFGGNETVAFTLQGTVVGQGTASATGYLPKATIHVPASATFGASTLTATGQTSGRTTTAPIDITNVWSQSGYGPTHTGYEPNDAILEDSIAATRNGYLSLAWLYESGAPVRASPAIVAGYAFVANTAGTLGAIDTVSGAPYWTYTIPSHTAIRTTPAVGSTDVFFGAQDKKLYRVAKATGALVGSEGLDGVPTSPALANGTVFVGTMHGTVYAIDAATGTQKWATSVGASIEFSPAVDLANGVVVAGDGAGNVTTLDANSGAIDFQNATGAKSITASPVIVHGKVIVAAADGVLRAYDERTGAAGWSYRSGGNPIGALAASTANAYIGTDRGDYAAVSLANGQLVFSATRGKEIVGLGHAADVTVDETASGMVTFSKDNEYGSPAFQYQTGAGLITQPAIVDGAVFIGAGDGGLYAFTNHGQSPVDAVTHRLRIQAMKNTPVPSSWPAIPREARVRVR